ncbi:N-acetylmuramoyl-L-alanine amidase [Jannaschia rubra]|uniref:N-acetylmuramoyl-L-alanine amidase n=1 Tax=Jannaschia rubra TaxID=282197 RepID=UPI002492757C|nr:N-acetylmuramoyl-L-alanine amidase [Jannaschia rubra]
MIRLALLLGFLATGAWAQADGRATVTASDAHDRWGGAQVTLGLSRAVPWRVFVLADPWRLVLDTAEVDWTSLDPATLAEVGTPATGRIRAGWSRLVLTLPGPMAVGRAWMETGAGPAIRVELTDGAGRQGPLNPRSWDAIAPDAVPTVGRPRQTGDRPLVIALDPGHGGIDPGAERGGTTEASLMLRFARELAEVLRREGHEVVLTRDADEFVGLRGRSTIARAAGADLMISLHADAVRGGGAEGATVYTLSDEEPGALAAEIAQRHGRDDLLLGAGQIEQGDEIARVLIEMARAETAPRGERLADGLITGLSGAGVRLHKRPRLGGRFTVLKAPDIPSVLLELGFMSDEGDLRNLMSAEWRARMAAAVARSIDAWAESDAEEARRLRQ